METNITKSVSVRQTAALQSYLHYLMSFRRASPNTIKAYAHDIAAFLTWCAQSGVPAEPNHITKAILFRYLSSISHLSPNTARRRVHAISSWFQYLIDSGEIGGNPARGLPLPKRERSLPRYPTPDQSRMLLAAARSPLERAVIWLLLTTGLRRAELIGLDLDDLRSDGSELLVLGKGHRAVSYTHLTLPTILRV